MMIRAGLYQRVSRAKDRKARSVTEQAAANTAAAEQAGWTITRKFEDASRSASRFATRSRPSYVALMAAIEADELDGVVLWNSSRGGRELEAWARFLTACRTHHVLIHVTIHRRTYDMAIGRDWKSLAEDGVASAVEAEQISEQTRRAHAANLAAGKPHGLAPYGYQRTYDPATGEMTGQVPDPKTAPVVTWLIEHVAHGMPIEAAVRDLTERGVPSPRGGKWTHASVRWVCLNVAYIAKRRHAGDLVDCNWPAIVDADTFAACTALLTGDGRKATRPGRTRWLLSMVARCAVCGGPMVARDSRGRQVYVCRAGGHVTVPLSVVDDQISGLVLARLSRPDAYKRLAVPGEVVSSARAEAGALRLRLAEYEAAAIAGDGDAASFGRVTAGLRDRIKAADDAAAAAGAPAALRGLLAPGQDVRARWDALAVAARKDVLRVLFRSITISPPPDRKRVPFDPDRIHVEWAMD